MVDNNFQYEFIPSLLDAEAVHTFSCYLDNKIIRGDMGVRIQESHQRSSTLHSSNDPLAEVFLAKCASRLSEIVGRRLAPTYSFIRVYLEDDRLIKHTDREACEYTVTINIATIGERWPLWLLPRGQEEVSLLMDPGDAVIYKGCEVSHWRDSLSDSNCELSAQLMLHYIDLDGPYANQIYDGRTRLGARRA